MLCVQSKINTSKHFSVVTIATSIKVFKSLNSFETSIDFNLTIVLNCLKTWYSCFVKKKCIEVKFNSNTLHPVQIIALRLIACRSTGDISAEFLYLFVLSFGAGNIIVG